MIIEVQHCLDCHLHNWCSRHNEAKYHDFYQKLESKVKSTFKKVEMVKNNPPKHFQQRNASATMGLQVHHYFDEERNEEVVFPRHGSFQIKVNGMLIFSKLQSNIWPNLQKTMNLLTQISKQLQAGKDIQRFSLFQRMENNKQELADTYKKLIKFQINKRPQSSQFSATAYVLRATIDQSPQPKPERFKRNNVTSLKKGTHDARRKSDVSKKPLIHFKTSKVQPTNTYSQFKEAKNEEPCQFPEVGKIIKNQHASPHSKKRIQFKGDTLHPVIAQPFDTIGNNNPSLKLEKKPSRKLILKTNEKKNENSPHFQHKYIQNLEDSIHESDKIIIKQNTLFYAEILTKKSLKSLKSVMSIGDKLQTKGPNDLKVQDYTQKKIKKEEQKLESKAFGLTSQLSIKDKTQKLVNQQGNHKQKNLKKQQKRQQTCTKQPKLEKQQTQKQEMFVQEQQNLEVKKQIVQFQDQRSNTNRKTENSNQKYEQELYDNYEIQQNHEQIRPGTSSSHRMYKQELLEKQEENLKYQQVNQGHFKRKTSKVEEKMNIQYVEDFAVEVQEAHIVVNQTQKIQNQQNIIQDQVFQLAVEQQISQPKQINLGKQAGSIQEKPQITQQAKAQPQNQQYKEQRVIEKEVVTSQRESQMQLLLQKEAQTPVRKQDIITHQLPLNIQPEQLNEIQEPEIEQKQMIERNQAQMHVLQEKQDKIQDKNEQIIQNPNQQLIKANQKQVQQTIKVQKQHQKSLQDVFFIQIQQKSSVQNQIGQKFQTSQANGESQKQSASKSQQKPCENYDNQNQLPQNEQLPLQNQKIKQIVEQKKVQVVPQTNSQQKMSPETSSKIIKQEKVQSFIQLPQQTQNQQNILELKQTHQQQEKLQYKIVQPQQNLEIQIQKKPIDQNEPFKQQILEGAKIHQNVQKTEEQQKIVPKQDQQAFQQRHQTKVSEKNEDKHVIEPQIPKSNECQAEKAESSQIQIRRQGPLPSIRLIPSKEQNSETQRSLPIATQSSIGLSSQIHSELNNVYEQIQARLDARVSLEQEDTS